ncbi:MAG TPA: hypothetical protein VHU19_18255 [Pyrinomonadaceae bacterium]|nr:hypothetical protein [Pyrinomonadaceae bacterium]
MSKLSARRKGVGAFAGNVLVCAFACASVLWLPAVARANMAQRLPASRPGDAAREPSGSLKQVRILRETLLIDLRPLKDSRPAVVEATYRVRNDGDAQSLELVFVAAALSRESAGASWVWQHGEWMQEAGRAPADEEGGVWLDGQPVAAADGPGDGELPKEWQPPRSTPPLEVGQAALPYAVKSEGTIVFRVTLAPGEHTFRVRYRARPSAYCDDRTHAVYWQLGYVLAPAREWASFGGLDAKVWLPAGWRGAASPAMRREGEALVASWDALPADALAVTAQTNLSTGEDSGAYWVLLIFAGALFTALSVFVGWKTGRWLGRRGRTSAWALLTSPVAALLLVIFAALVASVIAAPRAPEQACFNEVGGYDFIVTFFLGVIIFIWHFIITQTTAFIARRRTNLK